MNALNFSLAKFMDSKFPYSFCMHIFLLPFHFSIFEKDVGFGFKSYEHLHFMFGIKSNTTQTISNLVLAICN